MTYKTSKDYPCLWDLVIDGKEVACFVDGGFVRRLPNIALAYFDTEFGEVAVADRGTEYFTAMTFAMFDLECKQWHLEYIEPNTGNESSHQPFEIQNFGPEKERHVITRVPIDKKD